jgi:hypothetical protein
MAFFLQKFRQKSGGSFYQAIERMTKPPNSPISSLEAHIRKLQA